MSKRSVIKIYHGFGHKHDIVAFGHVFKKLRTWGDRYSSNPFVNLRRLLGLFFVQPVANVPLQLKWNDQMVKGHSEYDGFFRIEWKSLTDSPAGWHKVQVSATDDQHSHPAEGEIFIPHITQYGIISDIDDTVMLSYSATIWKRLKELLFENPRTREIFPDVIEYYRLLAEAHTTPDAPNPFFYVSSSEWNLYDYLRDVFASHGLPKGAFLLNQVKRWYELWKTGKTKHEGKMLRILRVLETFPNQQFVLLGDNSQSDPAIYSKLALKYPKRILAIYIRNINFHNQEATAQTLATLEATGVHTFVYRDTSAAIEHSREIGLLT